MIEELKQINEEQLYKALEETLYMSFVSLVFATLFGLIIGTILYCTASNSLYENRFINKIVDIVVNILRAIPFIILLYLIIPLTKLLTGSMLGATSALPSLILAATPFYARLTLLALNEVDKGTIEATCAMGASRFKIITKVLLPEAKPALISGICVTAISLVSYTAMAGAIGAGGLGNMAYLYGLSRRNNAVLYLTTFIIIIIVFSIQNIGDRIVRKIDKR